MTVRTSRTAKERDRIDWLLRNPLHYGADSARELLACCLSPLPDDPVTVLSFHVVNGQIEEISSQVKRSDAMVERLTSALNMFLVERTLVSEPSIGVTQRRLREIGDAADHLKCVLGMSNDALVPQLPWQLARRFMQVMGHSGATQVNSLEQSTDRASHYLTQAQVNLSSLGDAMSGLNLLHRWALAAFSLQRSQLIRRRKQPDLALRRLIQTLSAIWTNVLGQELKVATNHWRNVSRWAPIPDSYQHFVTFVRVAMRPFSVDVSLEELRAAISGATRRKQLPKRIESTEGRLPNL